jgi:hypothetical protein
VRAALLVLACAACVPYAVPPVTVDVGAARASANGARTGVHVDAGVTPMQLMPSQLRRPWDATLAASFDRASHNAWGASLAAGPAFYPWPDPEEGVAYRLLAEAVGRWTTDGEAAGLRVTLERVAFVRPDDHAHGDGQGYGEGALGAFAELDRTWSAEPGGARGWTLIGGLSVRVPFLAGVACCFH